jgi:putative membrane protein
LRFASLLTLAALGVAAVAATADEPHRGGTADDAKFSDKMFVEKAAIGGMFEVKSSQLAQQMATSPNVKRFAMRMVADHTKASQELMALAKQKGLRLPTGLDQKHQDKLDQLRKDQGSEFDRAYTEIQVKAHEKAVALFEKAAEDCQDSDLKAWATKTLPTLKEHEQLVKQLTGATNATTTTIPPPKARGVPPQ